MADAVSGVAATIAEMIDARVQKLGQVMENKVAAKTLEPLFSTKQAAEYFGVTLRTVDTWLSLGYLPYYKLGRMVRIPMQQVERCLRDRFIAGSKSR